MKCITLSVRAQGAPFDRLYFYGADRPIRVSYCILGSGQAFRLLETKTGNLIAPRPISSTA